MPTAPAKPTHRRMNAAKLVGDTAARWAWIAEHCKILDKAGTIRPLLPNRGQGHIIAAMHMQESRGLPVRIILLKARQFGGSTAVQADYFARLRLMPHQSAFTCAHEAEATGRLFDMTKRFHDLLDPKDRLPTDAKNGYQLRFSEPHGGGATIATAGSPDASRSGTYQLAHVSEFAYVRAQSALMVAIDAAVPYQPGTSIVIESTANGVGDEFHRLWQAAVQRFRVGDYTGYIPVFVSWLHIEDYQLPVPADYDWSKGDQAVVEDEPTLRQLGATDRQLYWRRKKIDALGGDIDKFRQDFPSTADEAFITSGRPAIPAHWITHHRRTVQAGRKARLVLDSSVRGGVRAEYSESQPEPFWRVWRPPIEGGDYCGAGDVAEGRLSDMQNAGSEPDSSAALFIERSNLEDVAEWVGRVEPDIFGLELLKAAMWYNRAWVTPEVNPIGVAALLVLKRARYPRIMQRQLPPDVTTGEPRKQDGWLTTHANRENMLSDLLRYLGPGPTGDYEGQMIVRSALFLDECSTFIHTKTGRREHMSGQHDDLLFARAICLQVHLLCPRKVTEQYRPRPVVQTGASLARQNAVDMGPWRDGVAGGTYGIEEVR